MVEVAPVFEIDNEVAFAVPRLSAAAESTERAPEEVEKVEAAPPVTVTAAPETIPIAPAEEFPMVTVPVEEPVLITVP